MCCCLFEVHLLCCTGLQDDSREDDRRAENNLPREVSDKMVCSACKCSFNTKEEQREHYKLDWHRFNLRQKIAGLPPLNAEEFEKKTGADLSSISGSESDSEDEGSDSKDGVISDFPVVLQNSAGEYLSVYRCVLQGKVSHSRYSFTELFKDPLRSSFDLDRVGHPNDRRRPLCWCGFRRVCLKRFSISHLGST
uniref:C2H2-type domain-containing protein n=1 Tax=Oryzias melastigma TaxID=30732 RepID=A0A3B3B645_ORYME